MASTSETGIVKTIANLETLISYCNAVGPYYKPTKTSLTIAALKTLLNNAQGSQQDLITAKNNLAIAINQRQIAFEPLKKLITRVVNALDALSVNKKIVEDAKSINKKVQGKRAKQPTQSTDENKTETKTISVSQLSFDNQIAFFSQIIDLLSQDPNYTVNEADLQLENLQAKLEELKTTNSAVINLDTAYNTALMNRNNIINAPETGIVDTTLDVKKYVKSLLGTDHQQYKQINKLGFQKTR